MCSRGALLLSISLLGVLVGTAQQPLPAAITLTASSRVTHASDPLHLEISLRNTSQESVYVCGTISTALLTPYGGYDIEVRTSGSEGWRKVSTKVSGDPMPDAHPRSWTKDEWKTRLNLFLLEPNGIIGRRMYGTWKGITVQPPGKYDVRVTYSARDLPVKLDKPFLSGTYTSNVINIEILP